MEQAMIRGVAHDASDAKLTLHGVPDRPGIAAAVFEALAAKGVTVDMIVQNISTSGFTDISCTVPTGAAADARTVLEEVAEQIEAGGVDLDENVAKVSIVGAGMKDEPGIAATMFRILADNGINIEMISTSSIRISCVVRGDQVEEAVRALHEGFALGEDE
jgi:aspartate kinase